MKAVPVLEALAVEAVHRMVPATAVAPTKVAGDSDPGSIPSRLSG